MEREETTFPSRSSQKKESKKVVAFKGSKTEKNLLTAFAGEFQARNRYTYFAEQARTGKVSSSILLPRVRERIYSEHAWYRVPLDCVVPGQAMDF